MSYSLQLIPGKKYRLIKAFTDYDNVVHPIGETWIFVRTDFLPYEDGLTVFIMPENNSQESSFRLQWRVEQQAEIINNFHDYVILINNKT